MAVAKITIVMIKEKYLTGLQKTMYPRPNLTQGRSIIFSHYYLINQLFFY